MFNNYLCPVIVVCISCMNDHSLVVRVCGGMFPEGSDECLSARDAR